MSDDSVEAKERVSGSIRRHAGELYRRAEFLASARIEVPPENAEFCDRPVLTGFHEIEMHRARELVRTVLADELWRGQKPA